MTCYQRWLVIEERRKQRQQRNAYVAWWRSALKEVSIKQRSRRLNERALFQAIKNKVRALKRIEALSDLSMRYEKRTNPELIRQRKENRTIGQVLRSRIRIAIKHHKAVKHDRTLRLIGCSVEKLKSHLEAKFKTGMTWENRGKIWHIDHIKPCAAFDLRRPEDQIKCFHYSNLQPLFALDNLKKGAKYPVAN